jgi:hypothetical protein
MAWVLCCVCAALTGCNLLGFGKAPPDTAVQRKLNALQIAIEKQIPAKGKAKVAVVAVVDTVALKQPAAGEEADQAVLDAAAKRERDVRQGLNESLVRNTLLDVLQPSQQEQDKARAAVAAANTCALDAKLAAELGQAIGAEYLVGAMIDDEGRQVGVAVQRVSDGVVVFQDTLQEWSIVAPQRESKKE